MKFLSQSSIAILTVAVAGLSASAHSTYRGYSGAPGSYGQCASSCHGSPGGTIQVSGFPSEYSPGQTYTINISHSGGSSIKQFNGSCRIGTGSQNAGVIETGTNTAMYNVASETNGVRLSSNDQNDASFLWTAPASGTGEVRLYIAGHQGSASGQNTTLMFVATELPTGVVDEESIDIPGGFALRGNYPNPFNSSTIIEYDLNQSSSVTLEIYDILGRVHQSFSRVLSAGRHQLDWNAANKPSGVYFYKITVDGRAESGKMLLLR